MIKTQDIVNFLQSYFDRQNDFAIKFYGESGKVIHNDKINAIVYTSNNNNQPFRDVKVATYEYVVGIDIPSNFTNENIYKLQNLINELIGEYNGTFCNFNGINGNLHINNGRPEETQIKVNSGITTPVFFTIKVEDATDTSTSTQRKWYLSELTGTYEEIPYLSENISVTKNGRIQTIQYDFYNKAELLSQSKVFSFKLPYKNNTFWQNIEKDLLNGDFAKKYKLKFVNGTTYTELAPFETIVSIYPNGQISTELLKSSYFNLSLIETDKNFNKITYEFGLIDFPFDKNSQDTAFFDSTTQQRTYFDQKVTSDWGGYKEIKAPNINNITNTLQVAIETDMYLQMANNINKNYAVLRIKYYEENALQQSELAKTEYYYYFANIESGANNQLLVTCELDTIQTYLFNDLTQISDCLIERASLNRFREISSGSNTVEFIADKTSELFANDQINSTNKYLKNRTRLNNLTCVEKIPNSNTYQINKGIRKTYGDNTNSDIIEWYNKFVEGWLYIYLTPISSNGTESSNIQYNLASYHTLNSKLDVLLGRQYTFNYGTKITTNNDKAELPNPFPVIALPILRKTSVEPKIKLNFNVTGIPDTIEIPIARYLSSQDLNNIINLFNSEFIYSVKFSTFNPLSSLKQNVVAGGGVVSGTNNEILTLYANGVDTLTNTMIECVGSNDAYAPKITLLDSECYFLPYMVNKVDGNITEAISYLVLKTYPQKEYLTIDSEAKSTFNNALPQTQFLKSEIVGVNNVRVDKNSKFNPKLLSQKYMELNIVESTGEKFTYDLQMLNNKFQDVILTEPLIPDITKKYTRLSLVDNATNLLYPQDIEDNNTGLISSNDTSIVLVSDKYSQMIANNKNYFTQYGISQVIPAISNVAEFAVTGNPLPLINQGISMINQSLNIGNMKASPTSVKNSMGNIYFNAQTTRIGNYIEIYDTIPQEKEVINDYMNQYGYAFNKIGNIKNYWNIRHYFNFIKANIDTIIGTPINNLSRDNIRTRFSNGIRFWRPIINEDGGITTIDFEINYSKENYERWLNNEDTQNNT